MFLSREQTYQFNYRDAFCSVISSIFETANESIEIDRESQQSYYRCIHFNKDLFCNSFSSFVTDYVFGEQNNFPRDKYKNISLENVKFLDVGCGVGEKVFLAKMFGFDAYGLDIRQPYVEKSKQLLNNLSHSREFDNKIFKADAITFDKYADFDIIYFYHPANNIELQKQIEATILKNAKIGAIVATPSMNHYFKNDGYMLKLHGWKAINLNYNSELYFFIKSSKKITITKKELISHIYSIGYTQPRKNRLGYDKQDFFVSNDEGDKCNGYTEKFSLIELVNKFNLVCDEDIS